MSANFKRISTYTDGELAAYARGYAMALNQHDISDELEAIAIQLAKDGIAEYAASTQEQKDEYNAHYGY